MGYGGQYIFAVPGPDLLVRAVRENPRTPLPALLPCGYPRGSERRCEAMASDYSIQGYSWKCSDSAETTNVWKDSPEAAAATRPAMEKLRELEGMASFKGNLFRPVFSYNFRGYPRHHPINLAAFPQRHVDFDMHSVEPGY